MRLWTIQPVELYKKLQEQKILLANPDLSEILADDFDTDKRFKKAYQWIMDMMDEYGITCHGDARIPWWAWHTCEGKHKKPDLRKAVYDTKGKRCVCMELEIPDDQVLLTSHTFWHTILADEPCWMFGNGEFDIDSFDTIYNIHQRVVSYLSEDQYKKYKHDSWKNIIDHAHDDKYIQATFWELRLSDVKKVWEFTAR